MRLCNISFNNKMLGRQCKERTLYTAIEFHTFNLRIEIVCGKCLSIICWWPINTEQGIPLSARGTKNHRQ